LRWTVSNPPCAPSTDDVTISVEPVPQATPTPQAATICSGSNAVIDVSTTLVIPNTRFKWGGSYGAVTGGNPNPMNGSVAFGTGAINDGPLVNATLAPIVVTYTIWPYTYGPNLSDDGGTGDDCVGSPVMTTVTVNPQPTAANAGPNQTICYSTSATLAANAPAVGMGAWSVVSGPDLSSGQFSNTADEAATFTPSMVGTYMLRWTVSNPPCAASFSDVTIIHLDDLNASVASANESCLGNNDGTITISSPMGGAGTYEYSIDGGMNWQPGGSFTMLSSGNYDVRIRDAVNTTCEVTLDGSLVIGADPCATISGTLLWKGNGTTGVALANVALTGDATNNFLSTPVAGIYTLTASTGSSFTVTPTKHIFIPPYTSLLNGVDAADATAIQQHLTGIAPITDFYRLVAADANKSYSISTVDAAIIRQALLGNPSALNILNATKSWRFVPTTVTTPYSAGYTPPVVAGPYTLPVFPEKRVLTGVSGTVTGENFFGIKVGDVYEVGGIADPANKPGQSPEPLVWVAQDRVLKAGETVSVDFKATNFTDLAAFQFALDFDPAQLQLEGIDALSTDVKLDAETNFGTYNIAGGELRSLWSVAQGITLPSGTPVFRLRFTARESGRKLSELLGLNNKVLAEVAYTTDLQPAELKLVFTAAQTTAVHQADEFAVQLLQNRPNPFSDRTVISFMLPESCDAQLRVFDVSGRELLRIDNTYPAGYNEETIRLDPESSGPAGVLYYELTTPQGTLSKKMVRVRE
jgi:hypothetical protein